MSIRFLSKGPAEQISGGYLYNKYLMDYLRRAGMDVRYHPDWSELGGIDATDTVIVDSLVIPATAVELLSLPAKLILLLHVVPDGGAAGPDREAAVRSLYRRSRVVVTGDSTLTSLRDDLTERGVDAVKIEPGVPGHWQAKSRYAQTARRLLGVANYVCGKGIDRVLDVLRPLRDLPWTLTVYGNHELDPSYFATVAGRAEAYRLTDRIKLLGPIPHDAVHQEMLQADLLVHFSDHESYSMVTAEAIACGLPVLSYRTGNSNAFGRSGLVRYLERDASASAALGALIDDRRAYAELRRVGRRETRSWEDVGREFLAWMENGR
jgi:glycosyltransferase involved in cell wall biosynthesis